MREALSKGMRDKTGWSSNEEAIEQASSGDFSNFDWNFATIAVWVCKKKKKKRQGPGWEIFGLYSLDVEAEWELSTPFLKPY